MASRTARTIRERLQLLGKARACLAMEAAGHLPAYADNYLKEFEGHLGVTRAWLRIHLPLHGPLHPNKQQRDALVKLVMEGWDNHGRNTDTSSSSPEA